MSIRNLQHIALAVPDATVGKKFYTDFGMEGRDFDKRIVMRCQGRDQDQVVLVEGRKKHMHHVSFGTRAEDLEAALLLLCSDASTFMTGATIAVDGGHAVSSL